MDHGAVAAANRKGIVNGLRAGVGVAVVLMFALLTGCTNAVDQGNAPTPSPQATLPFGPIPPGRAWVAVFETARDPNNLRIDVQGLIERVDGAALQSPIGCYEGLSERLGVQAGYFTGVIAATKRELKDVVELAGYVPIATARVEQLCPD